MQTEVTDVTQLKQNMDLKEETGIEAKLLNSVDCLDSRDWILITRLAGFWV